MNIQKIKVTVSALVLGMMSPLAMVVPASAASTSWSGALMGADNKASSSGNWSGGSIPGIGDEVVFGTSGVSHLVNLDIGDGVGVGGLTPASLARIVFSGEFTGTSSKSYSISGNAISLGGNIEAIMTGNGGDQAVKNDIGLSAPVTFKTAAGNTLSVGGETTTLALGAHELTLDASGGTISILGKITGSGNIVKAGSGKVQIETSPGTGGYTGAITIPSGEVSANGTLGNISVNGGTLKGTGTVGNVAMSLGSVAPGNSPGVLNTGNLTYSGGSFDVEIGGKAAGEFDQTNVTGTVTLGSETTLNIALVNSFTPAVNDSFVIINNDAEDAISGTFKGLDNGAKATLGGYTYQINYDAGTGNDVVLLVTGTPGVPDTGIGSIINNPFATLFAAIVVAATVYGFRRYEQKAQK